MQLSCVSVLSRENRAHQASLFTADDAVKHDFVKNTAGVSAVRETHRIRNQGVREGRSGPPLHIHLRQEETFEVQQGVLGVVLNGKEHAVSKDDGRIVVPCGARHRFWAHESSTEDLIVTFWFEPQGLDHGVDESFMRNVTGYVRDCERHRMAPSVFQIMLFMYHSDMVLTPPFWTPVWLLVALHHVLAYWVGAGLLGYKASYPEYSLTNLDKKST
ncbi:hypothetical protein KVR01_011814 [Diaporthe batatas]|uniref:uncharacterized protein n=1 Tax=Diaporthe batatas TaxID=748121 RepID=UPI001D040884|nr:uncharacterized protein KVR01_011814 [Diaporthe batatas]KAG8158053.1 hypothetical protein KVR01_011814 [Diaporthe batatas]